MSKRGFTLIELLVVVAISVILLTVGVVIYSNCLRLYREGQGLQEVYESSKYINRDLRAYLSNVVPVRGSWIQPVTKFLPGQPDFTSVDIGPMYWSRNKYMVQKDSVNRYFNGPHTYDNLGDKRNAASPPSAWATQKISNGVGEGWWPPGFFGQRDGSDPKYLENSDVLASAWGWPRADYRLDADADDLAAHGNIACWFYAEERDFWSPHTGALDNSNIVLVSLKFTVGEADGREATQLSFLRHQVMGFDGNGRQHLKANQTYGNMLRAIRIVPWHVDATGNLAQMDDAALGVTPLGAPVAGGDALPRVFDCRFRLRNQANYQDHEFALRVFCQSSPQ